MVASCPDEPEAAASNAHERGVPCKPPCAQYACVLKRARAHDAPARVSSHAFHREHESRMVAPCHDEPAAAASNTHERGVTRKHPCAQYASVLKRARAHDAHVRM